MKTKRKAGPLDLAFAKMKKQRKDSSTSTSNSNIPIRYCPWKNSELLEELKLYGSADNPISEIRKKAGKPRKINNIDTKYVCNGALYANVAIALFNHIELKPTKSGRALTKTAISTFGTSIYDMIKSSYKATNSNVVKSSNSLFSVLSGV